MIAKISSSNTLYSALAYNQNKVDEDHAKVIFTNKMIETINFSLYYFRLSLKKRRITGNTFETFM